MLSERRYAYEDRARPWTVPAFIGLGVMGYLLGQVFDMSLGVGDPDDSRDPSLVLSLALSALFYWGLWRGRRWAYIFTIIGAVLPAMGLVFAVLWGHVAFPGVVLFAALVVGEFYLLFHPLTRAYFKEHPLVESADAENMTR